MKVRYTIRMNEKLNNELNLKSKKYGVSKNILIQLILAKYLKKFKV